MRLEPVTPYSSRLLIWAATTTAWAFSRYGKTDQTLSRNEAANVLRTLRREAARHGELLAVSKIWVASKPFRL